MPPKVFISYSWTSPDHEEYVIKLAEFLRANGVDSILDKWDLVDGNDTFVFMEKMVTDPKINKVLLICDKSYVNKANNRNGGVGTESQIISSEVYNKTDQIKFIAVVVERDENGDLCVPVFLKSRKHIDFTSGPDYERLLRAIFDKPLHIKPPLGKPPSFITDTPQIVQTSGKFFLFQESIKQDKKTVNGNFIDFLEESVEYIKTEYIEEFKNNIEHDEQIFESITRLKILKNQICEAIILICKYNQHELIANIPSFLEKLLEQCQHKTQIKYNTLQFDNIKFFVSEFFLTLLAIFIQYEKYTLFCEFIDRTYIYKNEHKYFNLFKIQLDSLDYKRNTRLKLNRLSPSYDLLKERCDTREIHFNKIMEVDLILWFRSFREDTCNHWFPGSLMYFNGYDGGKLPLFLRAESKTEFEKIKMLFGVDSINELCEKFILIKKRFNLNDFRVQNSWDPLPIEKCFNLDALSTI